jgi:HD-like signal output (HDOD) protein
MHENTSMMNEDLPESIVEGIVTLPTIPPVLADLNAAIAHPDSTAVDIARIISRDPATATKVLRLANSAYYGLRNKVTTINHAVTMLGFNIIRNLVLTATVFDASPNRDISGLFEAEKFWRHSLGVGIAARIVAKEAFPQIGRRSDDFFICGLLHDLGKIILSQHVQAKFEKALISSRDRAIPLFEAEKRTIGCTHADVGRLLAKRWNLSPEVIFAVGYHHSPEKASDEYIKQAATTHLADIIARGMAIGAGGGSDPELDSAAWDALKLGKRKIPAIIAEIDKSLDVKELGV